MKNDDETVKFLAATGTLKGGERFLPDRNLSTAAIAMKSKRDQTNYWDDDKVFFIFVGFSIALAVLLISAAIISAM